MSGWIRWMVLISLILSNFHPAYAAIAPAAAETGADSRPFQAASPDSPPLQAPTPAGLPAQPPPQPAGITPPPENAILQIPTPNPAAGAAACTINWTGGNGAWSDAAHWDLNRLPNSSDSVCIPGTASAPLVTLTTNTYTIAALDVAGWLQVISSATLVVSGTTNVSGRFSLQNATFQGYANVTVGGAMDWAGGTIYTPSVQNGLRINGTLNEVATTNFAGRLDLYGTLTQSGSATFVLYGGYASLATFGGSLYDLQGDGPAGLALSGGVPMYIQGTFRKSAGSGTAQIQPYFNLQGGTLDLQSGSIALANGVSTGGTYNVAGGSTLDLVGNGYQATFSGAYTGSGAGHVLLSQGILQNTAPGATFNFPAGYFQWTGGNIYATPLLTNQGEITIAAPDSNTVALYGTLTNQGTIRQKNLSGLILGTLNNEAGALYDLQSDGLPAGAISGGYFNNQGTFTKTGGSGTAKIPSNFNLQGGTVNLLSGNLNFFTGISTGGTYNAATGTAIDLAAEGYTASASGTYTGAGGGKVVLSHGQLHSQPGGLTLNFPPGYFQWTGGSIYGGDILTNLGEITVAPADGVTVPFAGTWINQGTIRQKNLSGLALGTLTNQVGALYDLQSDGLPAGAISSGTFTNLGTFTKSAGTGTALITTAFNLQDGTVNGQAGNLNFTYGNNSGGVFNAAAGAVIDLVGAGQQSSFAGTYTGGGAGHIQLSQGIFHAAGSGTTLSFPPGFFNWKGGTFYSNATYPLTNAGHLQVPGGSTVFVNGLLYNTGVITQGDGATLNLGGALLTNLADGLYDVQGGGSFLNGGNFINQGTLRKSAAGSGPLVLAATLVNTLGRIDVLAGPLNITSSSTLDRPVLYVETGAVLELAATNNYIDVSGVLTNLGPGLVRLNGAYLRGLNAGSYTLDFAPGSFEWVSGGLNSANMTNQGTIRMTGAIDKVNRGSFINNGTILQEGGGNLRLYPYDNIANNGTYEITGDGGMNIYGYYGPVTFTNNGVLRKSGGSGISELSDPENRGTFTLNNPGLVEVTSGTLRMTEVVTQVSGSRLTGGRWHVGPLSTLDLASYPNLNDNAAAVTLDGGGSVFTSLNSLNTNSGSLILANGRSFTTPAGLANSGRLELGPGSTLSVSGNYSQTASGSLVTGIGGHPNSGLFGALHVSGAAALAGAFQVQRAGGFGPALGDVYNVLTSASHSGNFSTYQGLLPYFNAQFNANTLQLTSIQGSLDLSVSPADISVPANGVPGQNVTINFTVHNLSPDPVSGQWQDSVYLSTDSLFSADDLLIGRAVHNGSLAGNGSYPGSLTAPLPGVADGSYYVIVIADSQRLVPDSNPANNTAASQSLIQTSLPVLVYDSPNGGTLQPGQSVYYRLPVDQPGDVQLAGAFTQGGVAEFYASYQALPTRSSYTYVSGNILELQRQILLTSPALGNWYVLVYGRTDAANPTTYQVTPHRVGLAIYSSSAASAGNAGSATLTLHGSGFSAQTTVALEHLGALVLAGQTTFVDPNTLYVTFNLAGQAPAAYELAARNPSGPPALLGGGFTVAAGVPGAVSLRLIVPGKVRPGLSYQATLVYSNTGGSDVPAPLIALQSNNAQMRLAGRGEYTTKALVVLGVNPHGVAGVLPPGFSGTIQLDMIPSNSNTLTVSRLVDLSLPMDFSTMKADLKPAGLPDDAWNAIFGSFAAQMGATWGSAYNRLVALDNHLSLIEAQTEDVDTLFGYALRLAENSGEILTRYTAGAFGRGRPDTGLLKIVQQTSGEVDVIGAGQNMRPFTPYGGGYYTGQAGDPAVLQLEGATFTLIEANGTREVFRPDGLLDFAEQPNGERISYTYQNGRIKSKVGSNGPLVTYEYNAQGLITRSVDSYGREHLYAYDPANLLLTHEEDASGSLDYSYVLDSNPLRKYALASVARDGQILEELSYDSQGRLVSDGRPGGPARTITYDGVGGATVSQGGKLAYTVLQDSSGGIGRMINANGYFMRGAIDPATNSFIATDTLQSSWVHEYDSQGYIARATDPLGHTQAAIYDLETGNPLAVDDQNGNRTQYIYDNQGLPTGVLYADGSQLSYQYDAANNLTVRTSRAGVVTDFSYTPRGLPLQKSLPGAHWDYLYDAHDNLIQASQTLGAQTSSVDLSRDALDRVSSITDAHNRTLNFEYDANGRVTRISGPDGYDQRYVWGAAGLLLQVTKGGGELLLEYVYDANNTLLQVNRGGGGYTQYTRDDSGRLTHIKDYAPGGGLIADRAYTYNAQELLASVTDAAGTTAFQYDLLGQLTQVSLPGGRTLAYSYDPAGNRKALVDSSGALSAVYTANNLNQYTSAGGQPLGYDADGNLTSASLDGSAATFGYDAEGRVISAQTSTGQWDYEYDALGRRSAVTHAGLRREYLYGISGGRVLAEYENGSLAAQYVYGAGLAGRIALDGTVSYYTTDASGNITALLSAAGTALNTYRYLPYGEKLSAVETLANPFTFGGAAGMLSDGSGLVQTPNRAYLPQFGRFASPDPMGLFGGDPNLYRYAANSPTELVDPSGNLPVPSVITSDIATETMGAIFECQSDITLALRRTAEGLRSGQVQWWSAEAKGFAESLSHSGIAQQAKNVEEAIATYGPKINPKYFAEEAKYGEKALEWVLQRKEMAKEFSDVLWRAEFSNTALAQKLRAKDMLKFAEQSKAFESKGLANMVAKVTAPIKTVTKPIQATVRVVARQGLVQKGGRLLAGNIITRLGLRGAGIYLFNPYVNAALIGVEIGSSLRNIPIVEQTAYNTAESTLNFFGFNDYPKVVWGDAAKEKFKYGWKDELNGGSGVAFSYDPNDLSGPAGYGPSGWINPNQSFDYTIQFENLPAATAPAQVVTVTETLDPALDWDTFELGGFGFGSLNVPVPPGRDQYYTRLDLRDSLGYYVDFNASLDRSTGQVTWILTSIDPQTGDLISDASAGFLPPDVTPPQGRGYLLYSIRPKSGLSEGTTIHAQASVVFDQNAPILTPVYLNTTDSQAPVSAVQALPAVSQAQCIITWGGQDGTGSGIKTYDVYVSAGGGAYTLWQAGTSATSALFTGVRGSAYRFYSVATDGAGNVEAPPNQADTSTTISTTISLFLALVRH